MTDHRDPGDENDSAQSHFDQETYEKVMAEVRAFDQKAFDAIAVVWIDKIKAEIRNEIIEEADRVCDDYARDGRLDREYACEVADEIAAQIRALKK
jgi:hypothetical protein